MKATMDEFKAGTLRSGSAEGPVVKDQQQAIAIGLSELKRSGKKGKPKRKRKASEEASQEAGQSFAARMAQYRKKKGKE